MADINKIDNIFLWMLFYIKIYWYLQIVSKNHVLIGNIKDNGFQDGRHWLKSVSNELNAITMLIACGSQHCDSIANLQKILIFFFVVII